MPSSMSSAQAILVGAVLIASAILFVSSIRPAEAQRVGPFQIQHHSNTSANAGVFRLDTASGEVSFCYIANAAGTNLVCTAAVR